jgi:hypothetical protein
MTEPEPYEDAVPPPYLAEATPEELAAYGTDENPWPPPPDDWGTAPAL